MDTELNYWDIRRTVQRMVPRQSVLVPVEDEFRLRVRREGRRFGPYYKEFVLFPQGWKTYDRRILSGGHIGSALEISCKAAGCPSPLNLDVWDGKICYYNCLYCFANHFRSTLYSNFFDEIPKGLRSVDFPRFEREFVKLLKLRGRRVQGLSAEKMAIALNVPVRVGVRFENFLRQEKRDGVALAALRLLAKYHYPVIVDTKSTLIAEDEYLQALSDNKGGAVVQISLSGVDEKFFRSIEPGAPGPHKRFKALKKLNEAGIRGIPRIEPYLPFLTDSPAEVEEYVSLAKDAGVEWICWDAFSHSTASEVTRRLFHQRGWDFDRMFLSASDSRLLTGILLWGAMRHFRQRGFQCSTYDDMNSIYNDDSLCCNVTGAFPSYGMNYTSTKAVEKYVMDQGGRPVSWGEYCQFVLNRGGFLSEGLRDELYHLWNNEGNAAYSMAWLGMVPAGRDEHGILWRFTGENPNLVRALDFIEAEA